MSTIVPYLTPSGEVGNEPRKLLDHHHDHLRKSGLSDETIAAASIYSETNHQSLALLLNRKFYSAKCGPAIVFPFHDEHDSVVLCRVRPDYANGKAKYLQPSDTPIRVYFPPSVHRLLRNIEQPLIVTEGEKKALAATQYGHPTIGLTGVDCWHKRQSSALLPDLEHIQWQGRKVYIAFDSDKHDKPQVLNNEVLLAAALKARGAVVRVVDIPIHPTAPGKMGLDDLLVTYRENERGSRLLQLIQSSREAIEPEPGELRKPAKELDPAATAAEFLDRNAVDGFIRLRFWRGGFQLWRSGCYRHIQNSEVQAKLVEFINEQFFMLTNNKIADVMSQLRSKGHLDSFIETPAWIESDDNEWNPREILATRSQLVHLPSLVDGLDCVLPATPKFFGTAAVDYEFSLETESPSQWLRFISQLWPDDEQSQAVLQEWFGYCLTQDTRQQKMLLLIGPKRSGKGTIARVLRALISKTNVAGPTLAGLSTNFGLWPLVGKSLAIVSDARLSGRTDQSIVVERLLSITGEDALTIDRKMMEPITCKLPTRLMIMSNELPRLGDASGALTSRMILLRLTRSFYGSEDHGLTNQLLQELPGILLWSIEGWRRLRDRGYFQQPDSSREVLGELHDLSSPVSAFVRERCEVGPMFQTPIASLFDAWKSWCDENGRKEPGTVQTFGRDLTAAITTLRRVQPRNECGKKFRAYEGIRLVQF